MGQLYQLNRLYTYMAVESRGWLQSVWRKGRGLL